MRKEGMKGWCRFTIKASRWASRSGTLRLSTFMANINRTLYGGGAVGRKGGRERSEMRVMVAVKGACRAKWAESQHERSQRERERHGPCALLYSHSLFLLFTSRWFTGDTVRTHTSNYKCTALSERANKVNKRQLNERKGVLALHW